MAKNYNGAESVTDVIDAPSAPEGPIETLLLKPLIDGVEALESEYVEEMLEDSDTGSNKYINIH